MGAPTLIRVDRLRDAYWPMHVEGWTLERVLAAEPIAEYQSEVDREYNDDLYDLGRIRFFYDRLRADGSMAIDPIDVETEIAWGPSPVYMGPKITDGHHRFAAAILAEVQHIPANFGGLIDQLEWLTGERPDYPEIE